MPSRVEKYFKLRAEGNLRRIVEYDADSSDIVYLRDDVAELHTDAVPKEAVDDSLMESLVAPLYDDVFISEQGELMCTVRCFTNIIELNFVFSDGIGVAVALDAVAMPEVYDLVAEARDIVMEKKRGGGIAVKA